MAVTTVKRTQMRYVRRRAFSRLPRSKKLLAWLGAQSTRLIGSVTSDTFVTVAREATGILTLTGQPLNNETVVIDAKTYTFQTTLTDVDGNVLIGAAATNSIDNLIAAITLGAGAGTTYATSTTLHPTVTAAAGAGDTMDATAKLAGTAGNSLATTETLTNGSWGNATLTGGVTSNNLTAASHGISEGEGAYRLTTAGTLPGGLALLQDYWVTVVDTNTVALKTGSPAGVIATITTEGSGVHTIAKAANSEGIFDILRRNKPEAVEAATDIDDLS